MGSGWPGHQKGEPVFEIDWHQFNLGYVPASRPQRTLGHGCIFVVAFANSTFQNWRAGVAFQKYIHRTTINSTTFPPTQLGGSGGWRERCAVCSSLYYEIVHTISATHKQQQQQQHKTDGGKSGNRNELAPGREWVGVGVVHRREVGYIQGRLPKTISARNRKAEPTTTTTARTTHNPVFRGALCLPAFLPVGYSRGIIGKICC